MRGVRTTLAAARVAERRAERYIPELLTERRHRARLRMVTDYLRSVLARQGAAVTDAVVDRLIEIIYTHQPHRTARTEELFQQIRKPNTAPEGEAG